MRAKFIELRWFSVLSDDVQRVFERNYMSTKYLQKIVACIVLTQSEYLDWVIKSHSACSEFSNEVSTNLANFRFSFVSVQMIFR